MDTIEYKNARIAEGLKVAPEDYSDNWEKLMNAVHRVENEFATIVIIEELEARAFHRGKRIDAKGDNRKETTYNLLFEFFEYYLNLITT